MIKDNRWLIDEAINEPDDYSLTARLVSPIGNKKVNIPNLTTVQPQPIIETNQQGSSMGLESLLGLPQIPNLLGGIMQGGNTSAIQSSNTATSEGETEDNGKSTDTTLGDILGLGQSGYSAYSSLANGGGGYGGLIGGALNSTKTAANGGSWDEDVPQAFFGIDDENDSEIMQALKGAGSGAAMGASFGPWGALIGGVLGLGASFLDDI